MTVRISPELTEALNNLPESTGEAVNGVPALTRRFEAGEVFIRMPALMGSTGEGLVTRDLESFRGLYYDGALVASIYRWMSEHIYQISFQLVGSDNVYFRADSQEEATAIAHDLLKTEIDTACAHLREMQEALEARFSDDQ